MNRKTSQTILVITLILTLVFLGAIFASANTLKQHIDLVEETNKLFKIQSSISNLNDIFHLHTEAFKKIQDIPKDFPLAPARNELQFIIEESADPEMIIHAKGLLETLEQLEAFEKNPVLSYEKSLIELSIHSSNFHKRLQRLSERSLEMNQKMTTQNLEVIKNGKVNIIFVIIFCVIVSLILALAVFMALTQRVSKNYVESIIQTIGHLLLVFDGEGKVLISNKKARDILERDEQSLRSLHLKELFEPQVFEKLSSHLESVEFETVCYSSRGEAIPVLISGTKLFLDSKNMHGYIISAQDLRNSKHLQRMLIQSEKMASLGTIAAGVAHEINNPVSFIQSNLITLRNYGVSLKKIIEHYKNLEQQTLKLNEPSLTTPLSLIRVSKKEEALDYILSDIEQAINDSLEGTTRIKEIVLGLRSFSRSDEATLEMADLNEIIESSLKLIWNELKYKCEVTKILNPLPAFPCYQRQIGQVLMNLLINAAQAIDEKGKITIHSRLEKKMIAISIEDTGKGIPKEDLERIFDPFFTTKPVGKGTGLGLSIAYGIIENHGGSIEVSSEVGKGTSFTILFPLEEKKNGT